MNVRVEYESTPIRHIAVQCPQCNKWFKGKEITDDNLSYEYDIYDALFVCPICKKVFSAGKFLDPNVHIEEVDYIDVYKDCMTKKEVWE